MEKPYYKVKKNDDGTFNLGIRVGRLDAKNHTYQNETHESIYHLLEHGILNGGGLGKVKTKPDPEWLSDVQDVLRVQRFPKGPEHIEVFEAALTVNKHMIGEEEHDYIMDILLLQGFLNTIEIKDRAWLTFRGVELLEIMDEYGNFTE